MAPVKGWRVHLRAGARQKPTSIRLPNSISFKSRFPKHVGLCLIYAFPMGTPTFGRAFYLVYVLFFFPQQGRNPATQTDAVS